MSLRTALYGLLGVVAAASALLSFAALRDLALACGFAPLLAWLLPVVIDAGAAAGSLVWLAGWAGAEARRFARVLALALLGLSIAANALGHALAAYGARPAWWVVVIVSAVAPAVLGAVVHLAVLAARPGAPSPAAGDQRAPAPVTGWIDRLDEHALDGGCPSDVALDAPGAGRRPGAALPAGEPAGEAGDDRDADRAAALIAAGAGRRRLARELDITEHRARELLAAGRRTGSAA